MELSIDTITKVYAPYIGCQAIFYKESVMESRGIMTAEKLHRCGGRIDWMILVLKPLSEITDDDAYEVAKLLNECSPSGHEREQNINFVRNYLNGEPLIRYSRKFLQSVEVYQYLQSKCYDLPHYLLDGQTIHQAGLAIYEKTHMEA